jgi:uncharacterized protein with NRDE domain
MCLIALAWRVDPERPFIVAANRDEFHARPTAAAAAWPGTANIYAGRDLQDGGTWMGISLGRGFRFAALTNHRNPGPPRTGAPSRGGLVAGFLAGDHLAATSTTLLSREASLYNGFNLLAADAESLWYTGNHGAPASCVEPGFHHLSNARLNTPWPKSTGLCDDLRAVVEHERDEDALVARLFQALGQTGAPRDAELPDTGVGLDRERMLAPRMIVAPVYGTRSSSVMVRRRDGSVRYDELSFDATGRIIGTVTASRTPA